MKKYFPVLFFFIIAGIFSWKFFVHGLLPIPADTLVGLYHPYRDFYADNYPNGMPFKNFLITDPIRQQYPWRLLAIEDIKNGLMPSWNPYSFSGTPLIANYQSAAFYPFNFLLLIFPFTIGWSLLVILQPIFSGIFMYLYLKKMKISGLGAIVGGLVFSFSGFNIAWFTWNTLGHVVMWLPLILYFKEYILGFLQEKRLNYRMLGIYGIALILAESMYILAGHVQIAFYVFCISNLYLLARLIQIGITKKFILRSAVFFTLSAAIIGFLTAFQTIPFLQFTFRSARFLDQDFAREGWFIPGRHIIQFFAPDFFGNPATLNYWGTWNYGELVGYIGIIPLIFVFTSLFSLRRRMVLFFAILATIALVFSTENTIAKLPFMLQIPLLSSSQPTRLLFIVDFCLAVLAAVGFDLLRFRKINTKKIIVVCGGLSLVYGLIWFVAYTGFFTNNNEDLATSKRNLVIPTALLGVGVAYVLIQRKLSVTYKHIFSIIVLLVIIADLFRFGWKFTPFVDAEYLYPTTESIEFLENQPGHFRVMSTDDRILPPNATIPHKIQTVDGYDPLYLKNYGEIASSIVRNKPNISPFSFNRIITLHDPNNRLIDLMNVKYVLSLGDINHPKLIKVFEEGQTKIYQNREVFPRAFLVNNYKKANSNQEAINFMYDQTLDLHTTAIVYDDLQISGNPLSENESVEITQYANSSVEMKTKTDETRLLVLSDVYYPKWKVCIDGVESKIYEVNYAFRGVIVPSGEHTIEFKYL